MSVTVTKYEEIARVCHEVNRAFCESIGDHSQKPWNEAAEWQRAASIEGVRAIAEGRVTKPSDSHDAWMVEKQMTGWSYGATRDAEKRTHPCLVPFEEMPQHEQSKDYIYLAVARALLSR